MSGLLQEAGDDLCESLGKQEILKCWDTDQMLPGKRRLRTSYSFQGGVISDSLAESQAHKGRCCSVKVIEGLRVNI